jgi:hypothetical protein
MREPTADAAEARLNRLLNLILETAVEAIQFDAATITTRHSGEGVATIASTDPRMVALDDAQYESGEGPCISVLDEPGPIFIHDASDDDGRWEHFSRTAAYLGVHSTLSLHVPLDPGEVAASLNLYARRQLVEAEDRTRMAQTYAVQLAATIQSVDAYKSTARLARDMAEAMRSRAVIEQAKGMLMADERISADEAFGKLRELSQRANLKLRDVATRIVEERTHPPE